MKRIILFLLFTLSIINVFSQVKVTGSVVDNKQAPLEFANVVLQSADTLFGASTTETGSFELKTIPGNYTLKVSSLGYKPYEKEINLQGNLDLGEIQLESSTVELKEVVVKSQRITRRADRFVINLANDPTVYGKNGTDVLNTSPGVFIQERDGAISINGKSGTQVYVNERPLHESGTDLVRYLQNLKAEDIVRIEVVPNAGAEYDASITGGILKITLKNRRDDGMNGSAGVSSYFAPSEKDLSAFSPFFNINYRINKLSLYTQLNYGIQRQPDYLDEEVNTTNSNRQSHASAPKKMNTGQARVGGIYDLSDKQSVGLEVYYNSLLLKGTTSSTLTDMTDGNQTDIISNYNANYAIDNYSASANYLIRLDSLGSMFKVLLDYFHNKADNRQNYNSEYSGYVNLDSIYRSDMFTANNTYAVTADLSHHFNDWTTLSGGVKYARNEMNNDILFENQAGTSWNEMDAYSSINSFTEDISAIYGLLSSHIWKVSYSLGLRGEYTQASPRTNKSKETKMQEYFELFPSVNVMLLFQDGKHSLVANYKRTIQRPTFSDLNPFRYPASEYMYLEGNPDLKPAFTNDGSISLNLFYKYNLTAGVTDAKGAFNRVSILEPESGAIIVRADNVARNKNYYLAINGPVKPVQWWQIYLNITGKRNEVEVFGEKLTTNVFQAYMSNTFYLPKEYMLDLSGYYTSPFFWGNMKINVDPWVNISLRKQFMNKRLTATLFSNNLFNWATERDAVDDQNFHRVAYGHYTFRTIGLSLSYSFEAGKKVQEKKVETGAAEEKARLQ